jgi:hypothetical protein
MTQQKPEKRSTAMTSNRTPRRLAAIHSPRRLAALAIALALATGFTTLASAPATAQNNQPIVYPAQGQSSQQQSQDEAQCRQWAQEQTGFNPWQSAPTYSGGSSGGGEVIQGAGRGALMGLVGGAIVGDAGTGAAVGAGLGATAGLFRRRDNQQASSAAQQQSVAQYNQGMANFNRAFATCMQGRGYAVN